MRSARRVVGGMVQEKGSRQRCSSWTVLHAQYTSALSSGFPISQGNAVTLERWGGIRMISYFLSNILPKNYRNWIVYGKTIANQRWDVFWDTVYIKKDRKSYMSFRLVLKSVTLNDLERRNTALILSYFTEFGSFCILNLKYVYDVVVKECTFAIWSPNEFLVNFWATVCKTVRPVS